MARKVLTLVLLTAVALLATGCHRGKVSNPIADINSKQPDKVLYDRAMDAMKHRKYDIARLSLQTLINTYPDSEYIARAKLSVADSWYAEGGSTGLAQAEIEYKDFITFFPNMPEAAEAQLKVANIHYRQMAKPDRDYTHAKRAEDEYKAFLQQFPDAAPNLTTEAKLRLLEVQEVLAEREFRIGRFYFLRESYPAAVARLKGVVENYPLYSGSDEALFMIGNAYEGLIERVRANPQVAEAYKAKVIAEYVKQAAAAYDKIITRYPATDRVNDAKDRLAALRQPIPTPTPEAVAQSKAEEAGRGEQGTMGKLTNVFISTKPDVSRATKAGAPRLEEEKQTSPLEVQAEMSRALGSGQPNAQVGMEAAKAGTGAAPESEAPPSSETPVLQNATPKQQSEGSAAEADLPAQTNEAATEETRQQQAQAAGEQADKVDKKTESTSKKKKKKGLRKLIPF